MLQYNFLTFQDSGYGGGYLQLSQRDKNSNIRDFKITSSKGTSSNLILESVNDLIIKSSNITTINSKEMYFQKEDSAFGYWYLNESHGLCHDYSNGRKVFLNAASGNNDQTCFEIQEANNAVLFYIRPNGELRCQNFISETINGASAASIDSDINLKNSIQPFTDKHDILFDNLQGVSFKYNKGDSNRTHFGFIAQPTAAAAKKAGIALDDFAPICIRNILGETQEEQTWGIRYEEFVALNTDQIQKAKKRISELEIKCSNYEARIRRLEELILSQQGGDL